MDKDEAQDRTGDGAKPAEGATAAERALAEADERKRKADDAPPPAREVGREGIDPARYGDWEKGGIASDF